MAESNGGLDALGKDNLLVGAASYCNVSPECKFESVP